MTRFELVNYLKGDNSIKTDLSIVANTYRNIDFNELFVMLRGLRSRLNNNLYGKKWKSIRNINFHCLFEKSNNNGKVNTHSNIFIEKPIASGDLIKLVFEMRCIWEKHLGHELFFEQADSSNAWLWYVTKHYEDDNPNRFTPDILTKDLTKNNVQQKQNNYVVIS